MCPRLLSLKKRLNAGRQAEPEDLSSLKSRGTEGTYKNAKNNVIMVRTVMMNSGHKTRSVFDRYNIVSDIDLVTIQSQRFKSKIKIKMLMERENPMHFLALFE